MNFQIDWEALDITSIVPGYERSTDICTSIGSINVKVAHDSKAYKTFDTIVLYEEGVKKGTFYISEISKDVTNDVTVLSCQDSTKYLTDYFVIKSYELDYLSSGRFWIEKFMTEAGVDFNFNTSSQGNTMSQNSAFGLSSAYDIIVPILQQNGWYMYADANGTIQIGEFSIDPGSVTASFDDTEIITIKENLSDTQLRNRVVVWGNTDPLTNDWIHASVSVDTDWQIDSNDKRTVVLGDSNIRNTPTAYGVANRILNAFQYSVIVKTIEVVGGQNLSLGDTVYIDSKYSQGYGLITQLQSQASSSGLTTTMVLDKKCPRLFSFFSYDGTVYAATWGDGVYKKGIDADTTWSSYSSGLGNLFIRDLVVYNSIMICVANDGYAYKRRITQDASWSKISHGEFTDEFAPKTYPENEVRAITCSISRVTNEVFIGINSIADAASWVMSLTPSFVPSVKSQVVIQPGNHSDYIIEDLDTASSGIILTAATETSGSSVTMWVDFGGSVDKRTHEIHIKDETSLVFGPKVGNSFDDHVAADDRLTGNYLHNITIFDNDVFILYNGSLGIFRDGESDIEVYNFDPVVLLGRQSTIIKESDDKFHFVIADKIINIGTNFIWHYSFVLSTETLTLENTFDLDTIDPEIKDLIDFAAVNNTVYYIYEYEDDPSAISGWKVRAYNPITELESSLYIFGNGILNAHGFPTNNRISSGKFFKTNDTIGIFTGRNSVVGWDWELYGGIMEFDLLSHTGTYSETLLEQGTNDLTDRNGLVVSGGNAQETGSSIALNASFGIVSFRVQNKSLTLPDLNHNLTWSINTGGNFALIHSKSGPTSDPYLYGLVHHITTRGQTPIAIFKNSDTSVFSFINLLDSSLLGTFSPFDTIVTSITPFNHIKGLSIQIDDYDDTLYYMYQDAGTNYVEGHTSDGTVIKTLTLPDTDSMANKNDILVVQGKIITNRGSWFHVYESDISHIPDELSAGMSHKVLGFNNGVFESLDTIPTEARVEISKYSPTLIHSVPSGVVLILPTGAGWSYVRGLDFLARSYTNASGSWSGFTNRILDAPLDPLGPIIDARIFDIYKSGTDIFSTISGVIDETSNIRYIGYSDGVRGFASVSATISGDPFYIYIPAGTPSMIETTNYTFPQSAIFLSISGNPSSFFQKRADELIFNEQSSGLPNSNITVLKVDDRI